MTQPGGNLFMEMSSEPLPEVRSLLPWYAKPIQELTHKVGSGLQLLSMIVAVILLAAIGILNPSYRGGFVSFALFLFVFSGYLDF
jgi:Endomembrane protein 70